MDFGGQLRIMMYGGGSTLGGINKVRITVCTTKLIKCIPGKRNVIQLWDTLKLFAISCILDTSIT